ncbi:hypothetical protein RO3G_10108 [Rhizopus delemar RA 99-880]|uniref:MHD domain-containing protein n=1 Tax=Rhizopus delemar (strain RA 99-880 / ATCC MYA-4621 / FGSC 9543 / NRRL 43880) TaxID=246409 RepID=I1CAB8_RHIO9|nr:hypothetical protein RO3G_10108 [Rhizopus delemar RA 99-880]|eukprot:EIE85398.1 hypothetical protein RO3G_10108 [Rhizopus delemar RA 99-880]
MCSAQVEELYVKSLLKLAKKHYISNKTAFGTFLPMWDALYQELSTLCNIHSDYSKKIIENIEQPLRQCMMNNSDYMQVQSMQESLNKICKEYDNLEFKVQKHKKAGTKGELKAVDYVKQQEKKHHEWSNRATMYLKSYQTVDEYRWTLTKTTLAITNSLSTENEIMNFCSNTSHESGQNHGPLIDSSMSDASFKHTSLPFKKKRLFSSLGSIRRKSKSSQPDITERSIQQRFGHSSSLVDIHSMRSAQSYDNRRQSRGIESAMPRLRKAASFAAATLHRQQPQMIKSTTPPAVTDSEGYSIPPPDRSRPWTIEKSECSVGAEDTSSDNGSLFSSNPNSRIRVDIKNETVAEEGNIDDALNRMATILKEKNKSPTNKRSRGRREVRSSTQLYSVVEQPAGPLLQASEEANNEQPTIDVNIIETVNVLSRSNQIEQSSLMGEVYIRYTGPSQSLLPVCFQLHLPPFTTLKLTEHVSRVSDDIFQLTSLHLRDETVIVRYETNLESLPLFVKAMWKCEVDKSRLLIKYQKQPNRLQNVAFMTSITGDVQHASSIPSGELNLAHQRIKWDIGTLENEEISIIKAQFDTKEQGTPQPIVVRFDGNDLLSSMQVNRGNDSNVLWVNIRDIKKQVKSGKYIIVQ